jgi:CRP-like cAMP-binding protein
VETDNQRIKEKPISEEGLSKILTAVANMYINMSDEDFSKVWKNMKDRGEISGKRSSKS